ncbi:hypothetical protein BH10PLA1_BH10PLA1_11150 [soil metagenome]
MILASFVGGLVIIARRTPPRADLELWTFADNHARMYRGDSATTEPTLVDLFHERTGQTVDIKLIGVTAMNLRLSSVFDNADSNADVPDLVEIEISSIGQFFRPPLSQIGFLPLNDRLANSGWDKRILASRLAPWSKQGVIFGVPHDVHPVTLTYRRDLFEQAGVELSAARTWPEFQDKCLAFQAYWQAHGFPRRRAMELPSSAADFLTVMLLQRHINLLDTDNTSHLTDSRLADTVNFYAHCVAGQRAIGGDASPGTNVWIRDLAEGELCCLFTPDWRAAYIQHAGDELRGKLAMMPLPRFDPTDAPTGTWGGTMIAIPKQARDPDKSWQLLEHLYFSPDGMRARTRYNGLLPPVMEAWNDPLWHQPDAFYSGQKIGELYIDLARQLPERYVTPFTALATEALNVVLSRTVMAVQSDDEVNLNRRIAGWLAEADAEVKKRIDFGRFDE